MRPAKLPLRVKLISMKALLLSEYRQLNVVDSPLPELAVDEILLQVQACGICGSDVHGYDGSSGRRIPPLIMGHEAAGVIAQVGAQVSDWKVGDRVTFDSTLYCGRCHYCLKGEINLCANRQVFGVSCKDYRRNGAFARVSCGAHESASSLACRIVFHRSGHDRSYLSRASCSCGVSVRAR